MTSGSEIHGANIAPTKNHFASWNQPWGSTQPSLWDLSRLNPQPSILILTCYIIYIKYHQRSIYVYLCHITVYLAFRVQAFHMCHCVTLSHTTPPSIELHHWPQIPSRLKSNVALCTEMHGRSWNILRILPCFPMFSCELGSFQSIKKPWDRPAVQCQAALGPTFLARSSLLLGNLGIVQKYPNLKEMTNKIK